jgi:hypothetical protein
MDGVMKDLKLFIVVILTLTFLVWSKHYFESLQGKGLTGRQILDETALFRERWEETNYLRNKK